MLSFGGAFLRMTGEREFFPDRGGGEESSLFRLLSPLFSLRRRGLTDRRGDACLLLLSLLFLYGGGDLELLFGNRGERLRALLLSRESKRSRLPREGEGDRPPCLGKLCVRLGERPGRDSLRARAGRAASESCRLLDILRVREGDSPGDDLRERDDPRGFLTSSSSSSRCICESEREGEYVLASCFRDRELCLSIAASS